MVKLHFKDHFENIFKTDSECDWCQDLDNPSRISYLDRSNLEKDFPEEELKRAIWS